MEEEQERNGLAGYKQKLCRLLYNKRQTESVQQEISSNDNGDSDSNCDSK